MKFGQIKKPLLYKKYLGGTNESRRVKKNNSEIKWNLNEMLLVRNSCYQFKRIIIIMELFKKKNLL